MEIIAIADPETALALKLAGIKTFSIDLKEEVCKLLKELFEKKEIGIILITQRLLKKCEKTYKELETSHNLPLIIEIPDTKGPEKAKTTIEKMASMLGR